jgi:hypothetical protein
MLLMIPRRQEGRLSGCVRAGLRSDGVAHRSWRDGSIVAARHWKSGLLLTGHGLIVWGSEVRDFRKEEKCRGREDGMSFQSWIVGVAKTHNWRGLIAAP